MNNTILEAIIIGGGHAGLSASFYLKQFGIEHAVLERGRIGESWRSQRWDSFALNTANGLNLLPGEDHIGNDPSGYSSASRFVSSLEAYASRFQLPVAEQTEVISVEKQGKEIFSITASANGIRRSYRSRQVIICSGSQHKKKIPKFSKNLHPDVLQLHASEYRNALQLKDGPVLVVGSGQSGCQIADDLIDAGRTVYLSTSLVGRLPRKYRGKDIMDWLIMIKFFDIRPGDITDPSLLHMKPPQLTGRGGRSISLQSLAQKGATIIGKMENAEGKNVFFQPNAAMHVQFADEFSKQVKDMIDGYILNHRLAAPPPAIDQEDMPDTNASCASSITSLDLEAQTIRSVIWTTGFNADYGYIKLPILDKDGNPKIQNGLAAAEGLYFLGLPWLLTRKSGLIYGIKDDAAFICKKVYAYAE